jgi:hypothetical protein
VCWAKERFHAKLKLRAEPGIGFAAFRVSEFWRKQNPEIYSHPRRSALTERLQCYGSTIEAKASENTQSLLSRFI